MAMTLDQIVAEARQLPRDQAAQLLDQLLTDAARTPDPEVEGAWKIETRRRIAEIESGAEAGVAGDDAMAQLRRVVGR